MYINKEKQDAFKNCYGWNMIIGINIIPLFSEQGSGAFRYIKLILHRLGDYNLEEHQFVVYKQKCISEDYIGFPSNLNVKYVNVPNIGRGLKRLLFEQTLFYFYIKRCDVFYSYCSSIPFFVNARKVFTLHDVYFITEKERYGSLQRNYLRAITWLYVNICDKVLTVSEFSKKEILKYYKIKPDKLAITYNFIELGDKKEIDVSAIYDTKGSVVDTRIPYFLYVGNIHPGKNIIRMVNGFNKFNVDEQYQLLICGKTANSGESIIKEIEGRANVKYLGYQSRDCVDFLFQNCVAVVLVSLCEGFGIPPLEGIACHKPALVSKGTSIEEVVGKAGICVDARNEDEIAEGYKKLLNHYSEFEPHFKGQLLKFSAKDSVETFMKEIGIEWKKEQ